MSWPSRSGSFFRGGSLQLERGKAEEVCLLVSLRVGLLDQSPIVSLALVRLYALATYGQLDMLISILRETDEAVSVCIPPFCTKSNEFRRSMAKVIEQSRELNLYLRSVTALGKACLCSGEFSFYTCGWREIIQANIFLRLW